MSSPYYPSLLYTSITKTSRAIKKMTRLVFFNFVVVFLKWKASDQPSWIASLGQASAQEPQLMQVSGSIEYLSPSLIAPVGHTDWQVPHATQLSSITYAIVVELKMIIIIINSKLWQM